MSSPIARLQETVGRTDEDRTPRFVALDGAGDEVLDALGSQTSRRIYHRLLDEPASPSAVAEAVDTSVQNASYHISNLAEADLIEPVGTKYSEKGREMTVWVATDSCVVLGTDEDSTRESILSYLGAIGVLALLTAVVNAGLAATGAVVPAARTPLIPSTPGTTPGAIETGLSVVEPAVAVCLAGLLLLAGTALLRYRTG